MIKININVKKSKNSKLTYSIEKSFHKDNQPRNEQGEKTQINFIILQGKGIGQVLLVLPWHN